MINRNDFINNYVVGEFPNTLPEQNNPFLDGNPWWGIFPPTIEKYPSRYIVSYDKGYNFDNICKHIVENDDEYSIEFRTPGLNKNNLEITLQNNVLTIEYKVVEEENKPEHHYFAVSSFKETVVLSEKCNLDTVASEYKDGILKVSVQKFQECADEPKIKKIEIK
jgi:HSP20 family protein